MKETDSTTGRVVENVRSIPDSDLLKASATGFNQEYIAYAINAQGFNILKMDPLDLMARGTAVTPMPQIFRRCSENEDNAYYRSYDKRIPVIFYEPIMKCWICFHHAHLFFGIRISAVDRCQSWIQGSLGDPKKRALRWLQRFVWPNT